MPNAVIASFAKKSGKTESEVDSVWNETKQEVSKQMSEDDPKFWANVNSIVQKKLGISKSFKDFISKK